MRVSEIPRLDPQEVRVMYAEKEWVKAGKTCGPVVRSVYIIECCTGGKGSVTINGKLFPFQAGDAYVLLPGDAVKHATAEDSYREGVWCALDGISVGKYLEAAGITSDFPYISKTLFEEVRYWISGLVDCWPSFLDSGAQLRQTAYAYGLLGALLQGRQTMNKSDWLDKALGYMQTNYTESTKVEQVAQQIGLERAWFSVQFKKKMGMSPHQYLTKLRVQRACQLLKTENYRISEIAYLIGLEPHNFSRLFKREMGITPQEYQQQK